MKTVTILALVPLMVAMAMLTPYADAQLVAHWPLNDGAAGSPVTGADDVIDFAGHPAMDAVTTSPGSPGGTWFNDPSRGIVFSTGEDDRLFAGTQGIDRNAGFTWHGWVNVASSNLTDPGADVVLGTRAGSGGSWHKIDIGGGVFSGITNWADISGNSYNLADDTWHHIGYVGDNTSIRYYIDGVFIGQDTTTPTSTFDGRFEIGGSSQFSEDTTGLMSDVAIWNEALTEDELIALFEISDSDGLLYDAGEFDLLKQLHDGGVAGTVDIDGTEWEFVDSGLVAGLMADGSGGFTLGLNSTSGSGVQTVAAAVPEPASVAIWSLIGLGLTGFGVYRARKKQ